MLKTLRVEISPTLWEVGRVVIKCFWKQKQLNESQERIEALSQRIANHTVSTGLPRISTRVERFAEEQLQATEEIDRNIATVKEQLAGAIDLATQCSEIAKSTDTAIHRLKSWIVESERLNANLKCLHALYFPEIHERQALLKEAHEQTFRWVFEELGGDNESLRHQQKFRK